MAVIPSEVPGAGSRVGGQGGGAKMWAGMGRGRTQRVPGSWRLQGDPGTN